MATKKSLEVIVAPTDGMASTNRVYFSPGEFPRSPCYILMEGKRVKNSHIFLAEESAEIKNGSIALNKVQRLSSKCSKGRKVACSIFEVPMKGFDIRILSVECKFKNERGFTPEIDGVEFLELCLAMLNQHVVVLGQDIPIQIDEKFILLSVKNIELFDLEDLKTMETTKKKSKKDVKMGKLLTGTKIKMTTAPGSKLVFANMPSASMEGLFKGNSFRDMGIGGLDHQLKTLFRRSFASRIYPKEVLEKFGIQHIKGILLHGPPGTGKTLTARQIGNILNTAPPKLVNGPEVLNKFVGESERHVRELFKEAEAEYQDKGENSQLHLIIFDEIDAICKSRGTLRSGTGVNDSVVNQLLSKIDGVDSLNNVLIIGMTNRIDLIDEALLRAGRFEVKIEIGLPDEPGRVQIFDIHTRSMKDNGVMDKDVILEDLAKRTNNYSGAEIAGVVRSAVAFALNKHINFEDLNKTMENIGKLSTRVKVKMRDFERALHEVKPSFGISEDEFDVFLSQKLIDFGSRFTNLKKTMDSFMNQLKDSQGQNLLTVLIAGDRGCGKTSFAVHAACGSKYPFVKMISPQQMIGFSDSAKTSHIVKVFEQAYKSPLSVIILDNIERIIDYIEMGPRFSNHVLQALMVIVNKRPPKNRKLLIVGTTSSKEQMNELNLVEMFNFVVNYPSLTTKRPIEITKVLHTVGSFVEGDLDKIVTSLPQTISMKKLLLVVEMSKTYVEKGDPITETAFLQSLIDCGLK